VLSACGARNYQAQLAKELGEIHNSEMWRAGAASRALRPKQSDKVIAKAPRASPDARRTKVRAKIKSRWSRPAAFLFNIEAVIP